MVNTASIQRVLMALVVVYRDDNIKASVWDSDDCPHYSYTWTPASSGNGSELIKLNLVLFNGIIFKFMMSQGFNTERLSEMASNTEPKTRKKTLILQKHILIIQVLFRMEWLDRWNDSLFGLCLSSSPLTLKWFPSKSTTSLIWWHFCAHCCSSMEQCRSCCGEHSGVERRGAFPLVSMGN